MTLKLKRYIGKEIHCNTKNLVKEVRQELSGVTSLSFTSDIDHLECFAHTLQLIVHDAVFPQRSVIDTLAVFRRIVGHSKHSPLGYSKFKRILKNLGIPCME